MSLRILKLIDKHRSYDFLKINNKFLQNILKNNSLDKNQNALSIRRQ